MKEGEMGPHIWKRNRKYYAMTKGKKKKSRHNFSTTCQIFLTFTSVTKVPVDKTAFL